MEQLILNSLIAGKTVTFLNQETLQRIKLIKIADERLTIYRSDEVFIQSIALSNGIQVAIQLKDKYNMRLESW